MHIEVGFVSTAKVAMANISLIGILGYYAKELIKTPSNIVKTIFASLFFSLFMQIFHIPIGVSELHFIGAMPIYMILGFIPTMFGFAFGLILQGLIFDPQDLPHLALNSLSLIIPLITLHYLFGKNIFNQSLKDRISFKTILKFDAIYYSGVTLMVGFWILMGWIDGLVSNSITQYLTFMASYIAVVVVEPIFTLSILNIAKKYENKTFTQHFTEVSKLRI